MTELQHAAKEAIGLMDLTTLNDDDTEEKVTVLCHQAHSAAGDTAAVCIYPRFVPIAKKTLKAQGTEHIRVATVTNFPHGNDNVEIAVTETKAAVAYGADEVDVVFPYRALKQGNETVGFELVKRCKEVCAKEGVLLKVIIESGELKEETLIRRASEICIDAGADFIKTSTGMESVNATMPVSLVMVRAIREYYERTGFKVGFKPAGGISTPDEALTYYLLVKNVLGDAWLSKDLFRIGASRLAGNVYNEIIELTTT